MIHIPRWQLLRELRRVRRQIWEFSAELLLRLYFRRWYDLVTSRAIQRTKGALPFGREVAIYLIYPVGGLLASHLHMLAELRRAGISPLVASNLPLTEADCAKMRFSEKVSLWQSLFPIARFIEFCIFYSDQHLSMCFC